MIYPKDMGSILLLVQEYKLLVVANGSTSESHFSCSLCEQLTVALNFTRQAKTTEFEALPSTSFLPWEIRDRECIFSWCVSSSEGKGKWSSPSYEANCPISLLNVYITYM